MYIKDFKRPRVNLEENKEHILPLINRLKTEESQVLPQKLKLRKHKSVFNLAKHVTKSMEQVKSEMND